ncbi:hypothetical protein Cgig2_013390 [Carnegiea gigantea]|uniref:Uncharacterized protein n=1 Tax=Carnegiea gigantea TaxID=171969 RepID=A0A9Q1QDN6_9CARY|nr:hypothetical protein Cgig2_013390 [Carnegiea gigantea]
MAPQRGSRGRGRRGSGSGTSAFPSPSPLVRNSNACAPTHPSGSSTPCTPFTVELDDDSPSTKKRRWTSSVWKHYNIKEGKHFPDAKDRAYCKILPLCFSHNPRPLFYLFNPSRVFALGTQPRPPPPVVTFVALASQLWCFWPSRPAAKPLQFNPNDGKAATSCSLLKLLRPSLLAYRQKYHRHRVDRLATKRQRLTNYPTRHPSGSA